MLSAAMLSVQFRAWASLCASLPVKWVAFKVQIALFMFMWQFHWDHNSWHNLLLNVSNLPCILITMIDNLCVKSSFKQAQQEQFLRVFTVLNCQSHYMLLARAGRWGHLWGMLLPSFQCSWCMVSRFSVTSLNVIPPLWPAMSRGDTRGCCPDGAQNRVPVSEVWCSALQRWCWTSRNVFPSLRGQWASQTVAEDGRHQIIRNI